MLKPFTLFILSLFSAISIADSIKHHNLSGVYTIWGEAPFNNENSALELNNTHYYVYLEGRSAKDLYTTMQIKPRQVECHGDESFTKRIGNMSCIKSTTSEDYRCSFAIDVASQKITNADSCYSKAWK